MTHWDRQLPLDTFGQRIAHVKITPGDEALAEQMVADLTARGFDVLQTTASWERGLSHGAAYLGDMVTVSKDPRVYTQPYFLLLEDDSVVQCHGSSLEDLLLRSCHLLATNHEMLTARLIRRGDYESGVPRLADTEQDRAFYSPNTDFQPMLLRSIDFYRLCMMLDANPQACQTVQCEALWAIVLRMFSRAEHKHLVWKPEWAETVHLGTPDYLTLKASLNL